MGETDEKKATRRYFAIFAGCIAVLVLVVLSVLLYMNESHKSNYKDSLIVKSEQGFHYIENEYEYVDESKDKPIAVDALQKQLTKLGTEYSTEQLNKLPNYFVITILETADPGLRMGLSTMIPRFMHPDYDMANELVKKTIGGIDDVDALQFNIKQITPQQKKVVYDVIQSYPYYDSMDRTLTYSMFKDFIYITIPPKDQLVSRFFYIAFYGIDTLKKLKQSSPTLVV